MKLKTVSITYERKLNLGDNEDDEMSALWEKAKTSVKEQLHHLISAYKNKENPQ